MASGTESVENDTFKTLSTLKTLELWKNKLRQVPRLLPASLEVLKLNDNSIYVLHGSDFEGLKKLKILELKNNLISSLSPSTLSPLVSLQSLVLDDNRIESVAGPLALPHLKSMSMENNRLHLVPASFLTSLQSLQFLSFSGNFLTKIPINLPKSLLSLKMERNRLKVVRFRDMKHLENLSHLYLSANSLSSIDGAQILANLTVLEMSQNQVQMLPLRLPARLQKLDISDNLIQRVTAQDFQDLRDLKHLFLDNNVVSLFEAGALQMCSQLSNLALEQNLLLSIPLRWVVVMIYGDYFKRFLKVGAMKHTMQARKNSANINDLIEAVLGLKGRDFWQGFGISSPLTKSYTNLIYLACRIRQQQMRSMFENKQCYFSELC